MIKFFKKRKLKKTIESLEDKLISLLGVHFSDLAENHEQWNLTGAMLMGENQEIIQLLHMTTNTDYVAKHKVRNRKDFKIEGVEILNRKSNEYEPLKIHVYENLIQHVFLRHEKDILKEYDFGRVRVINPTAEKLIAENPDEVIVKQILARLSKRKLKQIDFTETFEINLEDKIYYSVFDLEEGNYIVIDKQGSVFRLLHDDHGNPIKRIAENLDEILKTYSGDKKDLEKYMT